MTRRRLLGGLITIGGAAAAAGAGTFALFSDSESSGNDITAGTLTLGSTTGSFSVTDIAPGDRVPSSGTNSVSTTYDGSISGAEIDLNISLAEPGSEPSEPSEFTGNETASSFAGQLNLETANLKKNGSSVKDLTVGNTTLADLGGTALDNQTTVSNGDSLSFDLAVTFATGAGNAYQADGVVTTVEFIAEQPSMD